MKIIKEPSHYSCIKDNNIALSCEDKQLRISYIGNDELYWTLYNKKNNINELSNSFIITKENYNLYLLFEKLFNDIKEKNNHKFSNPFETTRDEKEKYNDLYNQDDDIITWYSTDTLKKFANYFTIKKIPNEFIISFYKQNNYEDEINLENLSSVRVNSLRFENNSFENIFVNMFYDMQYIDDVMDENHQIHIEEYNYETNKLLLRK